MPVRRAQRAADRGTRWQRRWPAFNPPVAGIRCRVSTDDLHVYRRKLPHWRLADSTYFVTWRLPSDRPSLTVLERDQVANVLRAFAGQRYELLAYVVMNDHVHVVVQPHPGYALEKLMHTWKSYSARLLQRGGRPERCGSASTLIGSSAVTRSSTNKCSTSWPTHCDGGLESRCIRGRGAGPTCAISITAGWRAS